MANIQYCPPIPLSKLDATGANAGDHVIFNPGTGKFESAPDQDGNVVQALITNATATAVKGGIHPVDTTTNTVTINSPANPVPGDVFTVTDATANAGNKNITVDFGTDNFNGSTGAFTINCNGGGAEFQFIDNTTGWVKLS